MKYIIPITISLVLFAACTKNNTTVTTPPKQDTTKTDTTKHVTPTATYKLVWSDEFDYTGLPDATKWGYETGHVRNSEAQYYMPASLLNSSVANGFLTITGRYDSTDHTNPITSASLLTKGKVSFQYGRLEMRAKMPAGAGAWPAFWTKGINYDTVGWPACGEIDIMEWLGFTPLYVFGSLHMANASGQDNPVITPYASTTATADLSTAFHTYAIEWDSAQVKYYFDSTAYATYKSTDLSAAEWAQFTKPHFMLLNLALGGTSGGKIDSTKFPFTYMVDYVRYYKKQ